MARIFTISFTYDDALYTTMVTVRTTPLYIEYLLTTLEFDLRLLLPGNRIISPSPGNYIFPDATSDNSALLMKTIIEAVATHMQAVGS
ncbi:hypothetical protein [Flavisolibacter nicotianae]|uniref:hypothetical protein n=1 Tax=Flavisolibacter nicotianae TaxID=2364882 RepID=UPI000EB59C01|nr:hypothetical protein [Flavisolibacter nicotianae]